MHLKLLILQPDLTLKPKLLVIVKHLTRKSLLLNLNSEHLNIR